MLSFFSQTMVKNCINFHSYEITFDQIFVLVSGQA